MGKKIVVVGGGIAGLVAAEICTIFWPKSEVHIVEKESSVGGLLRRFEYGVFGSFDYGMHNYLCTGVELIDNLIFNLLASEDWQILEGSKRDLAGVFFNGRLQKNSPYVDLRESGFRPTILTELLSKASYTPPAPTGAADQFLQKRFGPTVTHGILAPILKKLYRHSIDQLDAMATLITPLGRLLLCDKAAMDEINHSDLLRGYLAYPEQRELNLSLSSGRKAIYPKNYGMYRIVDGLVSGLTSKGAKIYTDEEVVNIKTDKKGIAAVHLRSKTEIEAPDLVIWSAGPGSLTKALNTPVHHLEWDTPATTTVTNLLISEPLEMGDLYYAYNYDEGYLTFRITPFYNYSENSQRMGGYPVAVEMLVTEKMDLDTIKERAIHELRRMGVLRSSTKIIFAKAEIIPGGFPLPTRKNIANIDKQRDAIASLGLKNLTQIGILSEKNLFFQTDVLIDLYHKLRQQNAS